MRRLRILKFLATGAAVDPYLADQLILPLALASGSSELTTSRITQHLLTNAEVAAQVLAGAGGNLRGGRCAGGGAILSRKR